MGSGAEKAGVAERLPAFLAEAFFALAGARRAGLSVRPFVSAAAAGTGSVSLLEALIFLGTAKSELCMALTVPARCASSFCLIFLSILS